MTDFDFDLFVVGGGSGGVRAARVAAQAGAKVALAEEYRYGGTCVIRGCVPKKFMVYASNFSDAFEDAQGYGWRAQRPAFDWRTLISAKDAALANLESVYRDNLRRAGVTLFPERAVLTDPHGVRLAQSGGRSAKHILVATGGAPFRPDLPGADLAITSDDVFDLPAQPDRMLILGGGYIACEFACIMRGFGTHVTLVYRGEQILRGFDNDLRAHVAAAMRKRGVAIELERNIASIEQGDSGLRVRLDNDQAVEVDRVLLATGRAPRTAGLGLEEAGVKLGRNGAVVVDEWSQTCVPSVYAVGDVTDRVPLTPVAIREGEAFARTVFAAEPTRAEHALVASAVFTQPEIGTIGLTEAKAREKGPVEIYRSRFRPMFNVLAGRDEEMLMKLVVSKEDRKVLGAHVVGFGAAEMIQMAAIAVTMGATKEDFDRTVAIHPTAAEELVTMREPVA